MKIVFYFCLFLQKIISLKIGYVSILNTKFLISKKHFRMHAPPNYKNILNIFMSCAAFIVSALIIWMFSHVFVYVFINFLILVFMSCVSFILEQKHIFLDDNLGEECEFKQRKFTFRVLLSIYLVFCHLFPVVACKNVGYEK